tara:strand:+ start:228 stop:560 length:333 start_codon:yes stop_codon:yes gene_type:complete
MALFMARAKYNDEAFKGMVSTPQNREDAVKGLLSGLGIKLISIHYAPNTGEIFMMIDSTQEKNATMIMVVFSSGTFRDGEIIPLMLMEEMTESMKKAGSLLGTYKPANSN